jgi:hypothetical protein
VQPIHVVLDPKAPSGHRASSAAFNDDRDGSSMSVYLQSIVLTIGLTEASVTSGKTSGWAVAAIPVQTLTDEDQNVVADPILGAHVPHPCDPAHALVHGDKRQKSRREHIARASPLVHVVP